MSHHPTPGPPISCTEFMSTWLGAEVALIRDRQPKILGRLVHVTPTDDEHDPILVVAHDDSDVRDRVAFADLTRCKLNPTAKERK